MTEVEKTKVGIYHPFGKFPDNYSLSHVVKEQMLMLIENGLDCYFITAENFKGKVPDERVTVCNVLPRKNADKVYESCKWIIEELDFVLTHDVVYLTSSYSAHDKAIRRFANEFPNVKWLHWAHSAPNPNEKKVPIPNSIYIGMNYTDLPLLALQFQVPVGDCRVVYNPVSPDRWNEGNWHPFTKEIVDRHKLWKCDVLITYALDTGRFEAKGGHKIIKLVEKIRDLGKDAKVVFVNAAANTKDRRKLVEEHQSEYAIFTSRENKQYEVEVPREVVRQLLSISHVFPLLSISEGCSLTLLEAGLSGLLVILNADFPPMREFGEIDHVLYMNVSSTRATTGYNPDEDSYYKDWANIILDEIERERALRFKRKVLQQFNREWIWINQLEPLLRK